MMSLEESLRHALQVREVAIANLLLDVPTHSHQDTAFQKAEAALQEGHCEE